MIAALLIGFVGTLAAVVLFLLVVDPPEQKTSLGVAVKTAGQSRWSRFRRYRDAAMAASGLSAKPPAVAKEVIIAMAHRAVYRLNSSPANRDGCGDDDDQAGSWVRRMLASMCAKLDAYRPEVTRLQQIVDAFCGRLNAMCDTFEVPFFIWSTGRGVRFRFRRRAHGVCLRLTSNSSSGGNSYFARRAPKSINIPVLGSIFSRHATPPLQFQQI